MEKRPVPHEHTQALAVIEKQEAWEPNFNALSLVATKKLQQETAAFTATPDQLEDYKFRRLPVYFDAIQRGMDSVAKSVHTGLVVPIDDTTNRRYTMEKGTLTWKLVAPSDDPFARARFIKDARARGIDTSGTTTFDDDPFLIEAALNEGTKQQSDVYSRFMGAYDAITKVRNIYSSNDIFPSFQPLFDDMLKAEKDIEKQAAASPLLSNKDIFSEMLAARKLDPNTIQKVAQTAQDAYTMLTFFQDKDSGKAPSLDDKVAFPIIPVPENLPSITSPHVHERTFIVELFTNPDGLTLNNTATAAHPVTTYDRIQAFHEFIAKAFAGQDHTTGRVNVSFAIQNVLEKNTPRLEALCQELGVTSEVGMEYFRHMVSRRIFKDINEIPSFIGNLANFQEKRHTYNQSYEISGKQAEYVRPPKRADQEQEKKLDPDVIADRLIKGNVFLKSPFDSLSVEHKKQVLDRIFQKKPNMSSSHYYIETPEQLSNVITSMFDKYKIEYDFINKRFVSRDTKGMAEKSPRDSAKTILEKLGQLVTQNQPELVGTLEKLALKYTIGAQAAKENWDLDQKKLQSRFGKAFSRRRPATLEQDVQHIERICVNSALARMANTFPKNMPLELVVQEIASTAVYQVEQVNRTWKSSTPEDHDQKRHPGEKKLLPPMYLPVPTYADLKKRILEAIPSHLANFSAQAFPPSYAENRAGFFQEAFSQSVEQLEQSFKISSSKSSEKLM